MLKNALSGVRVGINRDNKFEEQNHVKSVFDWLLLSSAVDTLESHRFSDQLVAMIVRVEFQKTVHGIAKLFQKH